MSQASSPKPLAVIGAGAWGTVLSLLLARNGHRVRLWARRPELAAAIAASHENKERLPGIALPPDLEATADIDRALEGADAAFVAVPSIGLGAVAERLGSAPAIISCTKGLARPGLTRLSEVIARACPSARIAVLSGPNLAPEIAAGLPAAAVAASTDRSLAQDVQVWLQSPSFRVYTSSDPVGAEVGGALKNVIALAAGMSDGLRLGDNAKATILTRGLVEINRLGLELGGQRETLYGLAGLGDMIATCASRGSRNHTAGERLARGGTLADLERDGITAEGVPTVRAVHRFAEDRGLSLPIAGEVYRVVFERKSPRQAMDDLMSRASRSEW
jgi:glycerol-3-phosphate dehydrogenase (NAD(P)+)